MSIAILFSLIALLLLSAFFSGSETALFSLSKHQRTELARSGGVVGSTIVTLLGETRGLLITLLVGNMTVNVLYFAISAMVALHLRKVENIGAVLAPAVSVGSLMGLILLGEVLPKLTAARLTLRFARLIALPLLVFHRLIAPLRLASSWLVITPLARLIAPPTQPATLSTEELETLLTLSQSQGVIDSDEQHLLQQIMTLGQIKVRDLMVPRVDMQAHDLAGDASELVALIRATRFSHIPIYRGDVDNIVGLIDSRNVLLTQPRTAAHLEAIMQPAKFVPQQQRADRLLVELRMTGTKMVIVVDEYGGTAGLVTLEDVVEQMVGPIGGAQERRSEPRVEQITPGQWRVGANLSIHQWSAMVGLGSSFLGQATSPTISTLGGLVMARLGKLPAVADQIRIGNVLITVDAMEGRRIETLCVQLDQHPDSDSQAGEP
jgi:putative hemolysin